MKITPKSPDAVKASRPGASETRAQAPAASATGTADSVQLSSQASLLASGKGGAGEAPVNAERVEKIKEAIRNGQFTVNADKVADKLLEIERDLAPAKNKP